MRTLANMGILTILCECVQSNSRTRGAEKEKKKLIQHADFWAWTSDVCWTHNFSNGKYQIDFLHIFLRLCTSAEKDNWTDQQTDRISASQMLVWCFWNAWTKVCLLNDFWFNFLPGASHMLAFPNISIRMQDDIWVVREKKSSFFPVCSNFHFYCRCFAPFSLQSVIVLLNTSCK